MKSTEQKLKDMILANYKSVREFAAEISMPYSTIDSIFKRGVANASITNIIKICAKLNISADLLAKGELQKPPEDTSTYNKNEVELVHSFRSLNQEGQEKVEEYISLLCNSGEYKKHNKDGMGYQEDAKQA